MEKLPTEVAANIFSRLPFDSVLQCNCVSKYWSNLLQILIYTSGERYFAHKHRNRLLENHRHLNSSSSSSLPDSVLLMLDQSVDNNQTCNDDVLHYAEYNEDQNGFNCKVIKKFNCPLKMDSNFWTMATSSNGLICSAHQTHHNNDNDDSSYLLYVCNPFLGEYVTLPNKLEYSVKSSMAFGFGHVFPTDEYKVVRIVYPPGGGDVGNVEVYTLGGGDKSSSNGKWRSKGNIKCRLQCDSPGVLVNESLHWLAEKDEKKKQNIFGFDLLEEEFREIPLPRCLQANATFTIKELEGSLCGIHYVKEERKMLMWKLMEYYYMKNKEDGQDNGCWKNIFALIFMSGCNGFEHCFYWKKLDQSLLWMSNSSVVAVELDEVVGLKVDMKDLRQARLFHGIPHIKSFVSLTALGENDVKTVKDNNGKRKRDNKQRRKQKRRRLLIVWSSDDE